MPQRHVFHASYATISASGRLSKTAPSELKAKENCQTVIPRQENKNSDTDAIAHRPTTHSLDDANKNFPFSLSDKTSVGKKHHKW